MKSILLASCIVLMGAVAAHADCASEIARLGGGISKDGTLAPLSEPSSESGAISKDGSTMPLDSGSNIATSPADVQSQQDGGQTAAQEAMPDHDAAMKAAHEALANGDEDACMEALKGVGPS